MKTSSLRYILVVNGFILFITAIDINPNDMRCQLTTNLGINHSSNVVIVNINDSLVVNCSSIARNNYTFIYKWKKGADPYNINTTSFFSIRSITRHDSGKYECFLMNGNRTSKPCYVHILVNVRPCVTITKILIGKKDKIICTVSGYPMPHILMKLNGINVKNISTKHITYKVLPTKPPVGTQHFKFTITDEKYRFFKGNYTCVATNKYGTSSDTWKMNYVQEKCPKFKYPRQFKRETVTVGQRVSLVCTVLHRSQEQLDTFHFLPRFNTPMYNYINYTTKNQVLVMNYTIFHVRKNDAGRYNCTYHRSKKKECNDLLKGIYLVVKELSVTKNNIYVTIATSVSGVVVGIALLFLMYKMYLKRKRLDSQHFYNSMPELRWDVFVSYSSKDFPWVKELCETLEQPPFNLTACLHERDWEIGRTVIDNMADSVYCSLRTLIILSKHYIESSYCMQELQIAMHCELGSKSYDKERIIVIKLDDVSLKSLPRGLRQKSYLDFSSDEERKHFKAKLQRALPRREPPGETSRGNEICDDNCSDHSLRVEDITDQRIELLQTTHS